MNLKNKILLTLIAIIFAICLFNTNCFASDENILYLPPIENLENSEGYTHYYIYPGKSTGNIYLKLYIETEEGIYIEYNQYTDKKYVHNISGYRGYSFDSDSYTWTLTASKDVDSYIQSYAFDYDNKVCISSNIPNLDETFGDYIVYSDYSSVVFSTERGANDNTSTDSGETGNEATGGDSETDTDSDDSSGILSSIKEGFTNVVNFFTQIVDWLNPFSENFILVKLWDFLTTIIDYINPTKDTFILKPIINFLNPLSEDFFVYKLIDLLQSLFEFLFIPEENSFTGIIDIVKSKFDFVDTIKTSANSLKDLISNVGTAPKLTLNVNSNKYGVEQVTLIDLEWYKPYKTYGDLVLTGFIYALFLWRLFISIPNILNGFGGSVQNSYKITEIKGGKE